MTEPGKEQEKQKEQEEFDVMFYQLILSMQASAMQHLGKVMSQLTGKIERNLEAAKYSIDMLESIQKKTAGNLSEQEQKLVDHILYELRLNYVDESSKPAEETSPTESEAAPEESTPETEPTEPGDQPTEPKEPTERPDTK